MGAGAARQGSEIPASVSRVWATTYAESRALPTTPVWATSSRIVPARTVRSSPLAGASAMRAPMRGSSMMTSTRS